MGTRKHYEDDFKEQAVRLVLESDQSTAQIAKAAVSDYIEEFYNLHRRHSTLGNISPAAFEKQALSA